MSADYRDTDDMTLEELREEWFEVAKQVDLWEPYEGQEAEWDRRQQLWRALEERADVEQPECPHCGGRRWNQSPGDPVVCRDCDHEAGSLESDDEYGTLESAVHDAWDRIAHGDSP